MRRTTMTKPQAFNKAIGSLIRQMRKERGFTQTKLADALGITFQQVQKYERGTNGLAACRLPEIAAFFGVTITHLYEQAGVKVTAVESTPADNDGFLAARYVARIADEKTRRVFVEMARKFAYV